MFCRNCGNKLDDDDVMFCPKCGKYTKDEFRIPQHESPKGEEQLGLGLGICALIFGMLGGFIGLILSIVGFTQYKGESVGRALSAVGLVFSILWIIIVIAAAVTSY